MSKINHYAVRSGRESGVVVDSWDECSKLVTGYKGAEFKGFTSKHKAEKYIAGITQGKDADLSGVKKRIQQFSFKGDIARLGEYLESQIPRLKESVKSHSPQSVQRYADNIAAAAILIAELKRKNSSELG